jgi:hypothetical protein
MTASVFVMPEIVVRFSSSLVVMGVFARRNPSETKALQILSVAFSRYCSALTLSRHSYGNIVAYSVRSTSEFYTLQERYCLWHHKWERDLAIH